jgi:hypothetical protein
LLSISVLLSCTDKSSEILNKTYYSTVVYNSLDNRLEIKISEMDIPERLKRFGFVGIHLIRDNKSICLYEIPEFYTSNEITVTKDPAYTFYALPNIIEIPDRIIFERSTGMGGDMDLNLDISNLDNIKIISLINVGRTY